MIRPIPVNFDMWRSRFSWLFAHRVLRVEWVEAEQCAPRQRVEVDPGITELFRRLQIQSDAGSIDQHKAFVDQLLIGDFGSDESRPFY